LPPGITLLASSKKSVLQRNCRGIRANSETGISRPVPLSRIRAEILAPAFPKFPVEGTPSFSSAHNDSTHGGPERAMMHRSARCFLKRQRQLWRCKAGEGCDPSFRWTGMRQTLLGSTIF
jgi:hypothetical protein